MGANLIPWLSSWLLLHTLWLQVVLQDGSSTIPNFSDFMQWKDVATFQPSLSKWTEPILYHSVINYILRRNFRPFLVLWLPLFGDPALLFTLVYLFCMLLFDSQVSVVVVVLVVYAVYAQW